VALPKSNSSASALATPLLSVVIPTLNREQPLCTTLRYFMEREDYRAFEVIVVDQSDEHDPATTAYLESLAGRIRLERVGFKSLPRARNYGLKLATGDIVVFVDDDVEPWQGFLAAHLAPYADPKVWMVTGPSPAPGGRLTSRSELTGQDLSALLAGRAIHLHPDFDYAPCSWGVGCNISVRRSAAEQVGGFDETFVGNALGEDAEFCHRIRGSGGVIYYAARAGLYHVQVATGGIRTASGTGFVRTVAFNQNYFYRAVREPWQRRIAGNWHTYRRLVLNRYSLGRMASLHWAFLQGVWQGMRQRLTALRRPG